MPTYRNNSDKAYRVEDAGGNSVLVLPGQSIETFKILASPFTKMSDTPYFSLTKVSVNFTSPGIQTGLLSCSVIRLTAKAEGISIKCNVAANTNSYVLPADITIDIKNNGEIESLVFTGAGDVTIEGY